MKSNEELMKIVLLKPGEFASITTIQRGLKSFQSVVGGLIETCYFTEDHVVLICNEEGKINNLEMNRGLYQNGELLDVIVGTAFVCGIGEDDMIGLTNDLAKKYCKLFYYPERFYVSPITGKIIGRKYNP